MSSMMSVIVQPMVLLCIMLAYDLIVPLKEYMYHFVVYYMDYGYQT